ncbi:hypothetical protein O9X98_09760 [Agrobacterium salinitolerans]|nr:hypothetical protein [Agrobacterium salinitolerans]
MNDEQLTNVIPLRTERMEPYSEATMQEAIRNLGDPKWPAILDYARTNPQSIAGRFIGELGPVCDMHKVVFHWRQRNDPNGPKAVRAWKTVDDIVSGQIRLDSFISDKYHDRLMGVIQRAIACEPITGNLRYPASNDQRERLRAFLMDAKAERQAYLEREREAAALKAAQMAEKQRLQRESAARAREVARIANESAAASRLAEIGTLKGRKKHQAVLSSLAAADPVSRLISSRIEAEDIRAAKDWNEAQRQTLAVQKAKRDVLKAGEALAEAKAADIPKFRHLKVSRTKTNFRAVFQLTDKITLKSDMRGRNLIYTARSRIAKHRLDFAETREQIETAGALENYKKFFGILEVLDQELEDSANSRLTPLEVEQTLGITDRERLRWTKDGRLPTDGTDSFRKNGVTITFSLHPYSGIAAIKPKTVEGWRQDDIDATKVARSNGAKKAVKTKARNDATRKSVRDGIDKMAREASLHVLSPIAVPLIKLAILSTICSRWAKNRRDKGDRIGEAEFYELKDRGLKVIHGQPWTVVRFVPAGAPRYDVSLCELHRSDFRDDRREYQVSFPEWIADNVNQVRACRSCTYSEDHDFYALYELRMVIGTAEFCWHVPYSRGREWLPGKKDIEEAPPRADDDGIVLFGRPVNDEEMIVWRPQRLKDEMEAILKLFDVPMTAQTALD